MTLFQIPAAVALRATISLWIGLLTRAPGINQQMTALLQACNAYGTARVFTLIAALILVKNRAFDWLPARYAVVVALQAVAVIAAPVLVKRKERELAARLLARREGHEAMLLEALHGPNRDEALCLLAIDGVPSAPAQGLSRSNTATANAKWLLQWPFVFNPTPRRCPPQCRN